MREIIGFCLVFCFIACHVENEAPTIELLGENPSYIILGDSFIDPGAIAWDMESGNISSLIEVTGVVNTEQVGSYFLNYQVQDFEGELRAVTRELRVIYSAQLFQDNWNAIDQCGADGNFAYTSQILANDNPLSMEIASFNNLPTSTKVRTNLSGTFFDDLSIDQTRRGVRFLGTGRIHHLDTFSLNFTIEDTTGSIRTCSAKYVRRK